MLIGAIPFIPGTDGSSAIGGAYPRLGPCNLYFGKKAGTLMTGTTAVNTNSTTVTGVGTAFATEFVVGDYVSFGSMTTAVRITAIASPTSMTVNKAVTTALLDTVKKISCIYLGQTQDTTFKWGNKKKELTESQNGESPANRVTTGYECSVEATHTRATLERMARIAQGLLLHKDTNGVIDGAAFTLNLGEMDSDIWDELTLVRMKGGAESSDPKDQITIPLAAPQVEGVESKFDAATQFITKSMFTGYADPDNLYQGRPLIWYLGTLTP